MNQTIIGVFDTQEQAESAASRLEADGVPRSDIDIHSSNGRYEDEPVAAATTTRTEISDPSGAANTGVMGRIEHFFKNLFGDSDRPEEAGHYQEAVRRGSMLVSVDVADVSNVERVKAALSSAGAIDIDSRVAQWRSAGYAEYDNTAPAYTADQIAAERKTFPVVEEALDVGKREVSTGGVRVYSRVTETPVSESVNLREERATVERRAVDRPATAADLHEGSVEIRETAEQAVVGKTARVVEEVVVGREATTRTETINDTVKGTEVEIQRDNDAAKPQR
jgi:uncharacterized protein (TIGR02271 family)